MRRFGDFTVFAVNLQRNEAQLRGDRGARMLKITSNCLDTMLRTGSLIKSRGKVR